jgi:hypothetical protein
LSRLRVWAAKRDQLKEDYKAGDLIAKAVVALLTGENELGVSLVFEAAPSPAFDDLQATHLEVATRAVEIYEELCLEVLPPEQQDAVKDYFDDILQKQKTQLGHDQARH